MYSTTTLVKNSKLSGKLVGTHQLLDQAARKALSRYLPRGKFFPTARDIIHFEGARGPDGLKRKSPDYDDPSHMFGDDGVALFQQILDHRYNLVQALKKRDPVRAAFEAAWMAHKITDGLTPAHHFPLSEAKEELMSNKEFIKIFGEPVKGIMHGRSALETARNNWLYWGAGGYMSKHVGYEYGVAVIAAALPRRSLLPELNPDDFCLVDPRQTFYQAVKDLQLAHFYDDFRRNGWTVELAMATKNQLLPAIVRVIALLWYSAAEEAYGLNRKSAKAKTQPSSGLNPEPKPRRAKPQPKSLKTKTQLQSNSRRTKPQPNSPNLKSKSGSHHA